MNKVILIGRVVADPETRYSQGENHTAVSTYRIAVNRKYKKEGEQNADFINCIAFGKYGEFAEKHLKKGTKIAVVGRIHTGSYTNKEGKKIYTTDVVVEEHYFCEGKVNTSNDSENNNKSMTDSDGFMDTSGIYDDELPFK